MALVRLLVAAALAIEAAAGGVPARAAQPPAPAADVQPAIHHDTSPPLRSMKGSKGPIPSSVGSDRHAKSFRTPGANAPGSNSPNPSTATAAPAPGLGFDGIGSGVYGYSVIGAPPDTNGAVGLNHYVEVVNTALAVFDKTGTLLYGPVNTNTIWTGFGGGCESNNDGDATVEYDKRASRFVIQQFSVHTTPYLECVAVSTTGDPTGSYNRYSFGGFGSEFPDYPKLSVWPDAYYATFNMFAGGTTFVGPKFCAYDRSQMLVGTAATQQCFELGSQYGGDLPADMEGSIDPPLGSPAYFMEFGNNSLSLWKFHVDWNAPANTALTGPTNIQVAPFTMACGNGATCVPQAGTHQQLDSLGDRLMSRLSYRNFGSYESVLATHSVGTPSGVRWYEIRSPGGTPTVYQQSTYAPDSTYRWMPSIAQDRNGDIAMEYSVSSSSINPGISYTGRLATDPLNTMQSETNLFSGSGSQTRFLSRWGDYSSITVDPVDDCTFWAANEYIPTNGTFNWRTRIGNFRYTSCVGLSASPNTVNPGGTVTATWSGITNPTPTDWIGLYTAGAPDSSRFSFQYTTGAASGSISYKIGAVSPGTYELRLFANDGWTRLSTSGAFTVQSANLSASPSTINSGGTVTASWSGIIQPTSTDWIGLYAVGGSDSSRLSFQYITGAAVGSITYKIGAVSPGTYELRLFANNGWARMATSGPFTVQSPNLSASPSTVNPGGTVTASWSGIIQPTSTDWIGLYAVGAPDSSRFSFQYTTGTASGSITYKIAAVSPGTYEMRLFANDGWTRMAMSGPLTVQSPSLSASPSTVNPGGTVTASWSGVIQPTSTDWIGLYAAGASDSSRFSFQYTTGAASGSITYKIGAVSPGTYELGLFANDGWTRMATSGPFTVSG